MSTLLSVRSEESVCLIALIKLGFFHSFCLVPFRSLVNTLYIYFFDGEITLYVMLTTHLLSSLTLFTSFNHFKHFRHKHQACDPIRTVNKDLRGDGACSKDENQGQRDRNMGEKLLIRVDESDPLSFSLILFSFSVFLWG